MYETGHTISDLEVDCGTLSHLFDDAGKIAPKSGLRRRDEIAICFGRKI